MTAKDKYSWNICEPLNPKVVEKGEIESSKIIDTFKNFPWQKYLAEMNDAADADVHYSPSICFENVEKGTLLSFSASDMNAFLIFHEAPKKKKDGSLSKRTELREADNVTWDQSLQYLHLFIQNKDFEMETDVSPINYRFLFSIIILLSILLCVFLAPVFNQDWLVYAIPALFFIGIFGWLFFIFQNFRVYLKNIKTLKKASENFQMKSNELALIEGKIISANNNSSFFTQTPVVASIADLFSIEPAGRYSDWVKCHTNFTSAESFKIQTASGHSLTVQLSKKNFFNLKPIKFYSKWGISRKKLPPNQLEKLEKFITSKKLKKNAFFFFKKLYRVEEYNLISGNTYTFLGYLDSNKQIHGTNELPLHIYDKSIKSAIRKAPWSHLLKSSLK
jgi:hypothetical protein